MITVTFFYRKDQPESLEVERELIQLRDIIPFELARVEVDSDPGLTQVYGLAAPVVQVGPFVLRKPIGRLDLEIALRSAQDRESQLTKHGDQAYLKRLKRGHSFTKTDSIIIWLSHHYVALFTSLLVLFVAFSFIAPVLMKIGWTPAAKVIYTVYSPLCHQLSFRSWFLFGEQAYYPRNLAGIEGMASFEEAFIQKQLVDEKTDEFILGARDHEGNEMLGFKTALCQRDIAIYSSFALFGIFFGINKRRNKPISWWIWIVIGVIPMAFDGISQFPSLMAGLPDWLPLRESTPVLRTLTGGLFGFTSAWYLYPFIEESMSETRAILTTKRAVVEQSFSMDH